MSQTCFVTVGSTQFDELINAVVSEDLLLKLCSLGFQRVTIQCGSGHIPDIFMVKNKKSKQDGNDELVQNIKGIQIILFRYKPDISEDMAIADLIITHAGAGTCMEALRLGKQTIAVVNDTLMGNHQSELAEKLAEDRHLLCTTPNKLIEVLGSLTLFSPVPFSKPDSNIFRSYMEEVIKTL